MTARTVLTPIQLVADAATAIAPVAAASAMTVPAPGPYRLTLQVLNGSGAAITVTVRASGSGNDAAGNAQVNPAPSNTVYTQATTGDLVVSVPATTGNVEIPLVTTDRFAQADGSLSLDFSAITTVTVAAVRRPYNLV
jgi:hypothetical protein